MEETDEGVGVTVTALNPAGLVAQNGWLRIGDVVFAAPAIQGRLATCWTAPDAFDPDRYAPGREEHAMPFAHIGFGGGIHQCMAVRLLPGQDDPVLAQPPLRHGAHVAVPRARLHVHRHGRRAQGRAARHVQAQAGCLRPGGVRLTARSRRLA